MRVSSKICSGGSKLAFSCDQQTTPTKEAAEKLRDWMLGVLSELCFAWPERWDKDASPACWVKRTLTDLSLATNMSPCELLFGRKL